MKKTMVLIMSCLMLLAGCFHDDLSWKELLDAQGNKLSEQERALQELQARQEAEQRRLDELAGKYDGLKKSDTPFMLVMATNLADTITKSVDFSSLFRVNPSGVAVTKDMIALDCISSKQFFRVEPETKASYVKKSDHFSLKNLEVDKNAAGESLDGQYLATLTSASEAAVWDDSRMAFVGAYVDKEGKPQYISSEAFNTVMMPLPAEGLDSWLYPHASFKMKKTKKEGDTTVQEDTLGMVYVPLDGLTFMTQDKSDARFYSAANLSEVTFLPDDFSSQTEVEKGVLTLYDTPVPGKTYRTQEIRDLRIGVSDIDPKEIPASIRLSFYISVTIKAEN